MQGSASDAPTSPDSARAEQQVPAKAHHKHAVAGPSTTTTSSSPKQQQQQQASPAAAASSPTSTTPDDLPPFDWDDFHTRYQKALADADARELAVLKEFDDLATYFGSWARASAAHDDERAVKRLHTRQRFVAQSEERMAQKQLHCEFWVSLSFL
jgi:hypothetical protein